MGGVSGGFVLMRTLSTILIFTVAFLVIAGAYLGLAYVGMHMAD